MKKTLLFGILASAAVFLFLEGCSSDDDPVPEPPIIKRAYTDKAEDILKHSKVLTSANIGENKEISQFAWAFSYIYEDEASRLAVFKEVYNDSKTEYGKIYALAGIHSLNPGLYGELKSRMKSNTKFNVVFGESRGVYTFNTVCNDIEHGFFIEHLLIKPAPFYDDVVKK